MNLITGKKIYLDHGASTPVDPEVLKAMLPYFSEKYGNASSIHSFGREAKQALDEGREKIAAKLGAKPTEVYFTSGGTESNNWALKGTAFKNREKGKHIITTKIEHDCVMNSCRWLEKQGFEITYLDVDSEGIVKPETLESAMREDTIIVSIIHGNNEIGTIQDLDTLGKICKDKEVYFHTDACQSFTKVPIDMSKQPVDLMTINSHKIYGPKGVGALYVREGTKIGITAHGGGHERNKRSGTENISGIVGFATASETTTQEDINHMAKLRDAVIKGVDENIEDYLLNGPKDMEKRLCNNANFVFRSIEGEAITLKMDAMDIAVSTASACSSHTLETSHVLKAIGVSPEDANGAMRVTVGKENTMREINRTIEALKKVVVDLRNMSPLTPKKEEECFKDELREEV